MKCPECNGTKQYLGAGFTQIPEDCPKCEGTGVVDMKTAIRSYDPKDVELSFTHPDGRKEIFEGIDLSQETFEFKLEPEKKRSIADVVEVTVNVDRAPTGALLLPPQKNTQASLKQFVLDRVMAYVDAASCRMMLVDKDLQAIREVGRKALQECINPGIPYDVEVTANYQTRDVNLELQYEGATQGLCPNRGEFAEDYRHRCAEVAQDLGQIPSQSDIAVGAAVWKIPRLEMPGMHSGRISSKGPGLQNLERKDISPEGIETPGKAEAHNVVLNRWYEMVESQGDGSLEAISHLHGAVRRAGETEDDFRGRLQRQEIQGHTPKWVTNTHDEVIENVKENIALEAYQHARQERINAFFRKMTNAMEREIGPNIDASIGTTLYQLGMLHAEMAVVNEESLLDNVGEGILEYWEDDPVDETP